MHGMVGEKIQRTKHAQRAEPTLYDPVLLKDELRRGLLQMSDQAMERIEKTRREMSKTVYAASPETLRSFGHRYADFLDANAEGAEGVAEFRVMVDYEPPGRFPEFAMLTITTQMAERKNSPLLQPVEQGVIFADPTIGREMSSMPVKYLVGEIACGMEDSLPGYYLFGKERRGKGISCDAYWSDEEDGLEQTSTAQSFFLRFMKRT